MPVPALPQVHISPLEANDRSGLITMAVQSQADTYGKAVSARLKASVEEHFEHTPPEDVILVAKMAGKIVGYSQFGVGASERGNETTESIKELRKLYVATEHHGRGIGRLLMGVSCRHPVLADASTVYLWVWGGNKKAIRFYRHWDFSPVKRRNYTVGNTHTFDVMMARRQNP